MFSYTAVPATNNYGRGAISQGFGTVLISANPNTVQRTFVPEEKCWVSGIQVHKDGVIFQLVSDPYNGVRYYGNLKVAFPNKKDVPPLDAALKLIAEVLTVVPSDDQAEQPAPALPQQFRVMRGRSAAPEPVSYGETPAPSTMPIIAPPPPPSDAPPQTIALGQTKDQVTAGFGQPERIAKLGAREIFFYKDIKVTFTDGKVSDVE
jgi:hypothetical protein